MSENQWNEPATSENGPTPHAGGASPEPTSHTIQGPHFASQPPRVLARVPNLESAESELAGGAEPADEPGRMLSSRWSMRLLGVGGATLLVAALALPFFVNRPDSPEPPSPDAPPAWGPDRPAPSAALAPAWDGVSEGASAWQQPSGEPQAPEAQAPAVSAWSEQSPPLDWDASSQAQPRDDAATAQTWDATSGGTAWADQPATPGWDARSDTAVGDERRPRAAGAEAASAAWGTQGGVAVGAAPPSDVPVWGAQPRPAPGVYREAAGTWNEDVPTPRWPLPPYRTAQQPQASGTTWDGGSGSATPAVDSGGLAPSAMPNQPLGRPQTGPAAHNEASGPAATGRESYRALPGYGQPEINTNRSMRLPAYPESGTFDARADRPSEAQPAYRTADARGNPWSDAAANDGRPGAQDTARPSAFPSAFPTNHPARNGVAPADDTPSRPGPYRDAPDPYPAGSYRQTTGSPAGGSPSAADRAPSRSPTSGYPTYGNPTSTHPAAGYPAYSPTTDPETQYPAPRWPAAGGASAVDPRRGASGPSAATTLPRRDAAGGYPGYAQPGVARFQGGIQKPTGTEVHDDDRPSVY